VITENTDYYLMVGSDQCKAIPPTSHLTFFAVPLRTIWNSIAYVNRYDKCAATHQQRSTVQLH